ncbi:MAG: ribosome silencing factor [Treponema sp.]|nr:ribosome silencing factor [Treponema sp.]
MDAMLSATNPAPGRDSLKETALALGALLEEHRGGSVMVLDLRELNAWTDFFVIATVTSNAHLQGLQRHIKEFTSQEGIEILHRRRKISLDDQWNFVDLGSIVVHLMTAEARAFYELERLWGAETSALR